MYTYNGSHPQLGVSQQYLSDGAVIVVHYSDDYTKEEGSEGYEQDDKDVKAAEALIDKASSLMVSWRGDALVLATETAKIPDLSSLPVPARAREEEGILYMDLFTEAKEKKGGERA